MSAVAFQNWVRESRVQQCRAPERYLTSYPELVMDESNVLMTQELFEKIERDCGRYDGCTPTGEYLGKMFIRREHLCWFGISKEKPLLCVQRNSRKILIID